MKDKINLLILFTLMGIILFSACLSEGGQQMGEGADDATYQDRSTDPTTSSTDLSTSSTIPPTTSSSTTSTTSTSSTTSVSTTTTVRPLPELFEYPIENLDKCRNTVVGKANTFNFEIPEESVSGTWFSDPTSRVFVRCDSGKNIETIKVLSKGGGTVEKSDPIPGIYRALIKCGRTGKIFDLKDCEKPRLYVKTENVNITSFWGEDIKQELTSSEVGYRDPLESPHLDRFRGQGYHIALMHVFWICPSCVPAVVDQISTEPGVKSKSLGYGQDLSYVIYDPETVELERIVELAGAGGDVELYNDIEF